MKKLFKYLFATALFVSCDAGNFENITYDIVIENARVIDPETGLDSVLSLAIFEDKIFRISGEKLVGNKIIDGSGKVLSPGFIDLHAHGQSNVENSFQAYDGVTTALDLEVGVDTISKWLKHRESNALLNYGASACQLAYRNKLLRKNSDSKEDIYQELSDEKTKLALPKANFKDLENLLSEAIDEGAIGIGVPVGYLPQASVEEIAAVYAMAGKWQVPVFSHVREGGGIAFQQAIADAILNNAPLHICHINSMARKDIHFCLDLVEKAQKQGFQITTELYPYTAGNTEISSAIFDEGWQDRLGASYDDLQWVATGERLTPETFKKYRKQGGSVIVHMLEEEWVDSAIVSPLTMIASDGGDFSPLGHPRGAGTFSKIFRKYVRENELIDLPTAIKKMTLMPAQVLEKVVPEMKKRGRIQEGCFADLVLFDHNTIQDHATYQKGFVKSSGVDYLLVNGQVLISEGKLQENAFPGRAIKGQKGE